MAAKRGRILTKNPYCFGALTGCGCCYCAFQRSILRCSTASVSPDAGNSVIFLVNCPRNHGSLQAELCETARNRPGCRSAARMPTGRWPSPVPAACHARVATGEYKFHFTQQQFLKGLGQVCCPGEGQILLGKVPKAEVIRDFSDNAAAVTVQVFGFAVDQRRAFARPDQIIVFQQRRIECSRGSPAH
jgi:hypothetical protein